MAEEATGVLTRKISSTVSSPAVHYMAVYTAVRKASNSAAASLQLTFSVWLNSASSRLGTGIKLTAFVRIDGGEWRSVVLKSNTDSWSGTSRHTASLTLSVSSKADAARLEFYVSRGGSNYGGSAGALGSADNPKEYRVSLPAYSAADSDGGSVKDGNAAADSFVYVNVGGLWKRAVPYVKAGSLWKKAAAYVKVGGTWKSIE